MRTGLTTTSRGVLATLALASVVLLSTGCAPDVLSAGDGGGANGSSDGSGDGSSDGTDDGSGADGAESEVLTGAECLPGNWYLDNEEFGKLISGATGASDTVTGTVMLTLTADGKTHTHYDNWTHEITVDSAVATLVKNGTDHGTYTVSDDGTMKMIDVEISSDTVSKMEIGGKTLATAVSPEPSVFSQATFICNGDELTVSAEGGTSIMHREH